MQLSKSEALFAEAQKYIPGGVNSPVRSFKAVGGTPPFIARGKGSRVWDVDGNEYIDYLGSWGPLVLGHSHPAVVEVLKKTVESGTSFGAPVEQEVELAKMICSALPSVESVRLVSSGTEACMSAIRLARAFTGRDKIIKFAGCYHGHADGLLVKAGSGALTYGIPTSAGVPASYASETLVAEFNNIGSVERFFEANPGGIAAIIIEPVAGNMGVVPPAAGFLESVRKITQDNGALLIFDEVITGFRVGPNGAQGLYGITPDITTLGKIIGGGLPVGAYGGRKDIMEMVAPLGAMYQAGTLSGNPLAVKFRARLDGQLIGRYMPVGQGECGFQLFPPGRLALTGQPVNQIERHAWEDSFRLRNGFHDLTRIMSAAEKFKGFIIEGLHPHGQPVNTRIGEPLKGGDIR